MDNALRSMGRSSSTMDEKSKPLVKAILSKSLMSITDLIEFGKEMGS